MAAAHILVVDDDRQTLEMMGMLLKRLGYEVSEANDGQQALAHAAANTPDLIVLDLMMPGIDGYTVARRLRAQAATAHTPIIMFTAKGMVDDMAAGFEAGVDDYLTKPIDPAEMSEHIALALARHGEAKDAALAVGRVVACIGATAGAGLTAVCVNTAAALAEAGHTALVAGVGAAGQELQPFAAGGAALHPVDAPGLTAELARAALAQTDGGVNLLWVAGVPDESTAAACAPLADVTLLVMETVPDEPAPAIAAQADRVLLVAEPTRPSLLAAYHTVTDLRRSGSVPLSVALVATHGEATVNTQVVQQGLGADHLEWFEIAAAPTSDLSGVFRRFASVLWEQVQAARG